MHQPAASFPSPDLEPAALGIDVGGSAIKAGLVTADGSVVDRSVTTTDTPAGAEPDEVAAAVAHIVATHGWQGPVGVALPAVVIDNVVHSAANIDDAWIGIDAAALFRRHTGIGAEQSLVVVNDADAAGLAEITVGSPRARRGAVIFLTLGTGIGSALLYDGTLLPNSELGHVQIGGDEAEDLAAAVQKTRNNWSYQRWAERLSVVLAEYEHLFSPELFIIGGGISANFDEWHPFIQARTEIIPAQLRNSAGIVGAAQAALIPLS